MDCFLVVAVVVSSFDVVGLSVVIGVVVVVVDVVDVVDVVVVPSLIKFGYVTDVVFSVRQPPLIVSN